MKSIALGLLALFAVAISSGVAFADCAGHVVKTTDPTTVASTQRQHADRRADLARRRLSRKAS